VGMGVPTARSDDDKPEQRFSGLRSVSEANGRLALRGRESFGFGLPH
jgi:hypothetical protein